MAKRNLPSRPTMFAPPRRQRELHELNNSLAAVRLRLGLVTADATCMWAQRENLEAMVVALDEARALAARLEERPQRLRAGSPKARNPKARNSNARNPKARNPKASSAKPGTGRARAKAPTKRGTR
jgi:hypothetical protein